MTSIKTRYGVQPIQEVIRQRYRSVDAVALQIGVSATHLYNAVTGRIRPNAEARERLPKLMELPIEQLFTDEVLNGVDMRTFGGRTRKACGCVCEIHS